MYLLTEWEGRTGKYLARGHGVRTERTAIIQGKDSFLINPDSDSLYKKRNFAKQYAICAVVDSNSGEISYSKLRQNFPKGKSIRCSLVVKKSRFLRGRNEEVK